jgi:sec-independent protein translocase protein TatC
MSNSLVSSDDLFADTRMSFGEHLEELRQRLWRAIFGFGVILLGVFTLDFLGYLSGTSFGVARPMSDVITWPVQQELESFYDRRVKRVLAELEKDPSQKANRPTPFVKKVLWRAQVEAVVRGESADVLRGFPTPGRKPGEGEVRVGPEDLIHLWMSDEEPLREAALRQEAERRVGRRPTLVALGLAESMMVYFKVGMVCALVLGSPWIFWQLWSFVAAGLYPHEKRPIYVFGPFSLLLFLAGVLVCQFLVMPRAVEALLWFNEWLDFEPELRLNEWLGFAIWMPVVFGVAFQTPLVMLLLDRLGILTQAAYRQWRRGAWYLLAVVAAVITPSVDASNMIFLWVALVILYELGIFLCQLASHRRPRLVEEPILSEEIDG